MPAITNDDLSAWNENNLPHSIRNLPQEYLMRADECDFADGYEGVRRALEDGGEPSQKAFVRLVRIKLLILNLMRDKAQLPPIALPVNDWSMEDLRQPPFGNDFETSDNPKNKQGNRNSVSPKPGWHYRMVEANAELVCKTATFWNPDGRLNPERRDFLMKKAKRERGLKIWDMLRNTPDEELVPTAKKGGRRKAA
jgi:hypothetical protein